MPKTADPTKALSTVIRALEPLTPEDKLWVLQSASSRWAVPVPAPGQPLPGHPGTHPPPGAGNASAQAAIASKDARAFMRLKKPGNDRERVACLGYFVIKTTGQPGFKSAEITEAYTNSGGGNMNLPRALDNATRNSKFLSNRGKREKQLTTLGEDVVEALPDRAAVDAVLAAGAKAGSNRAGRGRKKAATT